MKKFLVFMISPLFLAGCAKKNVVPVTETTAVATFANQEKKSQPLGYFDSVGYQ
ncbi:MAG: hypothetical protein IJO21_02740 [Oscillospiraceae bacterium]|nr:hypothetical protein [Oscillospiraceae bacterium]